MNFEKFAPFFDESWHSKIKPFIESKECDEIYKVLKEQSGRGKLIAPSSFNTFRVFKEVPLNDINVIVLGYCPYHSFYQGSPVADGIGFSCSITGKLQPSLETMYRGLEIDLYDGLNLDYYKSPDLTYMLKQGIFLLNSSLTVLKDKAGSHQELWRPFTEYLFKEVFAYSGIPTIFIGKDASFYERYVTPLTHGPIFKCEHPAAAARDRRDWETNKVFSNVTRLVKQNNGINLEWLMSQEQIDLQNIPF